MKPILLLLIFLLISGSLTGCGTKKLTQPYSVSGFYFDTFVNITLYEDQEGQEHAEQVGKTCKDMCAMYENLFSATLSDSDVARINEAGGKPVEVDPQTVDILEKALYYAELTDGAFDPTMKSVSDLWNIRAEEPQIPEKQDIEEAISHVGYEKIHIDGLFVQLDDPETRIDLGGIAKGYIADQLTGYLASQGIHSAVISLGGNIVGLGSKPDADYFTIGLQKPFAQQGESIAIVKIQDQTVVTSGNYERFFEEDGVIYHHIMDPFTGAPVQNDLDAVTILSHSSTEADALSTAGYVMGMEKLNELLKDRKETYAVFIRNDLSIFTTDAFPEDVLELLQ